MAQHKPEVLAPVVARVNTAFCWVKKPGEHPSRINEPLTESKLKHHLNGGPAFGVCPIKPGESTTRVAVLDFDSHKGATPWDEMLAVAIEVAGTLSLFGLESTLFRSSGGQGIHLYVLWDAPQDAYSVRETMRQALAACKLKSGTGGVSKREVEIFPKQNAVPLDGFGSMFILPYAGKSEPIGTTQWLLSDAVPVVAAPPKPERTLSNSADFVLLQSALDAIPNSNEQELSYEDWFKVLCGIHHATGGSDDGHTIAHEFSSRAGKYDPDILAERIWPYIRSDREGDVITERTVFNMAASFGWQDPSIAEDFDAIPTTPSNPKRFTFVPASEFANVAPPSWIIKNVLPEAGLAVVYGASGSGKSFYVLDMATAIAAGATWNDKKTKQGRVAYIAAEGAGGFRNRLNAHAVHHGIALSELDVHVLGDAPNFMLVDDVKDLILGVRALGKVCLVIVDTFSQVMPGANENAGEDVGKALSHCREIHKRTGAMVLLVHHSGKDESRGARGWSGLRAAADCEIEIMRCDDDRSATITKLKDGEDGTEYGFRLGVVGVGFDEDGEVIDSCIVEHCAATAKAKKKSEPGGKYSKMILNLARDLGGLGDGTVPVAELLRESISKIPKLDGDRDRRRDIVKRAIDGLVAGGFLEASDDFVRAVK